jgi:hypothetical protein
MSFVRLAQGSFPFPDILNSISHETYELSPPIRGPQES